MNNMGGMNNMGSIGNQGSIDGPKPADRANNDMGPSQAEKALFDQIYEKHPEMDNNKDGKINTSELADGLMEGKMSLEELIGMVNGVVSGQGASGASGGGQSGGGESGGGQSGGGQSGGASPAQDSAPADSGSGQPIDENGDGKIDASEFMKAFDKNQDGKLNAKELSDGLHQMGIGEGIKAPAAK